MSDGPSVPRRGCGDRRTYGLLVDAARSLRTRVPEERLGPLSDLLWDALSPNGLSWVGFYVIDRTIAPSSEGAARGPEEAPGPTEMRLAARRDKPACSPIGLHGVCGQGFLEETTRLVEDVALVGAGYIACDPRDRSEVVVPVYRNGACWGVLDADSHEIACFGPADVEGLVGVLRAAGLLDRTPPVRADRLRSVDATL